uniref:Si:dkey-83h2.3 n=1 Tax=Scleropages formosus TaxID=113540 RepID=A0A8C9S9N9_SCLFO
MCVARCSRFVGVSLVPLAVLCILGNILLLLPDLQTRYLLEGHVTREATWGSGLWASGFLVRARCACTCSLCALNVLCVSTGLVNGPLCLHNSTEGPVWDEPPHWPSVCQEPRGVVLWNVVLFSILMAASAIQVLLCIVHTLNAILGMLCGNSFGRNKVEERGEGPGHMAEIPSRKSEVNWLWRRFGMSVLDKQICGSWGI